MRRTAKILPLVLILAYGASALFEPDGPAGIRVMQAAYASAALGWILLVVQLRRLCRGADAALPDARLLWGVALAARLLLLNAAPSDDVYRYVWEARVKLSGANPYLLAPDDARLTELRDADWSRINHPDHRAIYPPLAQVVFVLVALLCPRPFCFKIVLALVELAAIAVMWNWARRRLGDGRFVMIYALCPAALTAFAREAHLDALLVFGAALLLDRFDRPDRARLSARDALLGSLGLAVAVGVKWIPLVLGPWWLLRLFDGRRLRLGDLSLVGGCIVLLGAVVLLPGVFYLDAPPAAMLAPLRHFATEFHILDPVRQFVLSKFGLTPGAYRAAAGLAVVAVALGLAARRVDGATMLLWTMGTLLLLSPTLHPWYLTWYLPALCVCPAWPWLILPISIVFSYDARHVQAMTGAWAMPIEAQRLVFWPFFAGLLAYAVRRSYARLKGNPP